MSTSVDNVNPIAMRNALCERDFDAVAASFTEDAVLRGMLPARVIEATGRDEIMGWFRKWFANAEAFEVIDQSEATTGGRTRVTWRFRVGAHPVTGEAGVHVIEQTAYCDSTEAGITKIDLLCSGFRPE